MSTMAFCVTYSPCVDLTQGHVMQDSAMPSQLHIGLSVLNDYHKKEI